MKFYKGYQIRHNGNRNDAFQVWQNHKGFGYFATIDAAKAYIDLLIK